MKKHKSLIFVLILIFVLASCEDEDQINPNNETEKEEGSWLKYSTIDWTHDGNPISGTYCKIYSDGASQTLKLQCLEFADIMFEDILNQFSFDNFGDFKLPPENDKINVYINTEHADNIASAYWGTIFITIRTTELNTNLYEYLFKHELTHEFEFLIEGTVNLGTDVWFREAIAIYCGGGFNYINTVDDLEDWIKANENYPGQGNPIMIHKWEDFTDGSDITGYYCNVFDITMKYLLDPKGLNKSYNDVLNLFYEIREGNSFDTAFQNNFGLSLTIFEVEFYDRIRAYLLAL